MKIIQYVASLWTGGAESVVRDYAIALKNAGHDVTVAIEYYTLNTPNEGFLRDADIAVKSFFDDTYKEQTGNIFVKIKRRIKMQKEAEKWLLKLIDEEKPDVIHVHLGLLHRLAPIAASLNGIKLIYTCHNEPEFFFKGKGTPEQEAAQTLIDKCGMTITALHEPMAERLKEIFPNADIRVLYNPVNINTYKNPKKDREKVREELNIPQNAFLAGHVGRFSRQKNHVFLLETFEEIRKLCPEAFLLMIGEGELKGLVEEMIKEKGLGDCTLVLSNRADMPDLYAAMDVFLLPSLFEGFPITLLEAQSAGLPCYISNEVTHTVAATNRVYRAPGGTLPPRWARIVAGEEKLAPLEKHMDITEFDITNICSKLTELYKDE